MTPVVNELLNTQSTPIGWTGNDPAELPDQTQLEEYTDRQDVNDSRNEADIDAELSISEASASDAVLMKQISNQKNALGLFGPNDFFDMSVVRTYASGQDDADEPDGFRLYLLRPPMMANSAAFVAWMGKKMQEAHQEITDFVDPDAKSIQPTEPGDGKVEEIAREVGQTVEEYSDKAVEFAAEYIPESVKDGLKSANKFVGKALENVAGTEQQLRDTYARYVDSAYGAESNGVSFYSIVLPVPKELVDAHSHNIDSLMMSFLPRALNALGMVSQRFEGTSSGRRSRSGGFLGGALGAVGDVAGEALAYGYDIARTEIGFGTNPNIETVYSSPSLRQFQFTFEVYIRSEEERNTIRDFISRLKQHSYPLAVSDFGTGQNQTYMYPGEVFFEFSGRFRDKLFRCLRPCIITSTLIAYSDGNQYQHFEDGNTIVYIITIGMSETRLLDRNILVESEEDNTETKKFSDNAFRKELMQSGTFVAANEFVTDLLVGDNAGTSVGRGNSPPGSP